jgi:tRNA G26 N,N-dimethylase Trm1
MPISYYNIHELCKDIKTRSIPKMELLLDKIQKNGYRASRTHFDFTSIKTDMDIISLKQLLSKIDREEKSNDIG